MSVFKFRKWALWLKACGLALNVVKFLSLWRKWEEEKRRVRLTAAFQHQISSSAPLQTCLLSLRKWTMGCSCWCICVSGGSTDFQECRTVLPPFILTPPSSLCKAAQRPIRGAFPLIRVTNWRSAGAKTPPHLQGHVTFKEVRGVKGRREGAQWACYLGLFVWTAKKEATKTSN